MKDAQGQPIVLGELYMTIHGGNQRWTSVVFGIAKKIYKGVNGDKITLDFCQVDSFSNGQWSSTSYPPNISITGSYYPHLLVRTQNVSNYPSHQ